MATVSFEISTAFLTRMRAAILAEYPNLTGQTNAQLNEAARVFVRQMARDWVLRTEARSSAATAISNVPVPTDADIL